MAQGRFLNKSIAHSSDLADLSQEARELFLMAVPHLDREGRMEGDPRRFRAIVCPLLPHHDDASVALAVVELVRARMVVAYTDDAGKTALFFPSFEGSQPGTAWKKKERPSRFGTPPENSGKLPTWLENAGKFRTGSPDNSRLETSGNFRRPPEIVVLREEKGSEREVEVEGATATPPPPPLSLSQALLAELRRYPGLREVATPEQAEAQAANCAMAGITIADLRTALGDLGPKAAARAAASDAWTPSELAERVFTFARRAKLQRASEGQGDTPTPRYKHFKPDRTPEPPREGTVAGLGEVLEGVLGRAKRG